MSYFDCQLGVVAKSGVQSLFDSDGMGSIIDGNEPVQNLHSCFISKINFKIIIIIII